jgi:biotin carboxyl carrier protein
MRENDRVPVDHEVLATVLEDFERFELSELVLTLGDARVELTSDGAPPRGTTIGPVRAALHRVVAPTVGLVQLRVAEGAEVSVDDVLCSLDVTTSTVDVQAGVAGVVRTIDVADGALAEYGQSLVGIESRA